MIHHHFIAFYLSFFFSILFLITLIKLLFCCWPPNFSIHFFSHLSTPSFHRVFFSEYAIETLRRERLPSATRLSDRLRKHFPTARDTTHSRFLFVSVFFTAKEHRITVRISSCDNFLCSFFLEFFFSSLHICTIIVVWEEQLSRVITVAQTESEQERIWDRKNMKVLPAIR